MLQNVADYCSICSISIRKIECIAITNNNEDGQRKPGRAPENSGEDGKTTSGKMMNDCLYEAPANALAQYCMVQWLLMCCTS